MNRRKMSLGAFLSVAVVAVSGAGLPLCRGAEQVDRIIAVVNEEVITSRDVQEFFTMAYLDELQSASQEEVIAKLQEKEKEILDKLVNDRLLIQAARKEKIEVDAKEVDDRVRQLTKDNGGEAQFQKGLIERGLTLPMLKDRLREQFLIRNIIERKIRSRIEITPKEVTEYYNAYPEMFSREEVREYESLKFTNKMQALYIYKRLCSGDSFDMLKGIYPESVADGSLRKDEASSAVLKTLFAIKQWEFTRPVRVGTQYVIFHLLEIKPKITAGFSEAKERIYAKLYMEKFDLVVQQFLKELRQKAYIKIYEDSI